MLKQLITDAGHECIFLPKFHCELNSIEIVCSCQLFCHLLYMLIILIYKVLGAV
ncbi:hypothetical protein SCLCIDRAFT_141944 [Scleroderma citrinum Foug A]|uniref:Uncharacterized protein n=1 Tax=Scleroderma citrinum Foug A TaxID=1036808 RepID=A0A0C3D7Q5_9AGAM|nr:hypothetical protein SCLCIDRAFT_141944 [Scleroderma citrinum Foug A]